jgi:phosphoglycerate dehydrogenase-like enzyme
MSRALHRVALSHDFRLADGSPAYPDFDLSPLRDDPRIEMVWLPDRNGHVSAEDVRDIDALVLLVPRFDAASIAADGRLALVARFGVGYDSVDVAACTAAGIAVSITPDGVRRPVAQAIMALILALAGRLMIKDRITREGPAGFHTRSRYMGTGLVGRTLASIGLGNIGAEMFRLAAPFGMRHVVADPAADPALARELGVELVPLDEVFRQGDFVTVNCPLLPATRHLVDARRIALMKPSAYLVNTARGPIVDQRALVAALSERRIAGAGLDVFDPEPPPADDPVLALDNVIVAPHALSWTDQGFGGIGASALRSVAAVLAGTVPDHLVDRGVTASPIFAARLAALAARRA